MAAETSGTRVDLDRLIFFSDGVFAIAITLLALDLRLPPGDDVSTSADLTRAILRTAPRFLSFFISFQVIGVFWLAYLGFLLYLRRYFVQNENRMYPPST